ATARRARTPSASASPRECAVSSTPQCSERVGEPLGLDPMRRIEMMPLLEHLELKVGEYPAEPVADLAELVLVAQPAECEVDGAVEALQGISVEVVRPERLHERADPAGALRHPGRRFPRRRWRWLHSLLHVEPHELAHEPVGRE